MEMTNEVNLVGESSPDLPGETNVIPTVLKKKRGRRSEGCGVRSIALALLSLKMEAGARARGCGHFSKKAWEWTRPVLDV